MEIVLGILLGLWLMFVIWMTLLDGPNFGYVKSFLFALVLPFVAVRDLWR